MLFKQLKSILGLFIFILSLFSYANTYAVDTAKGITDLPDVQKLIKEMVNEHGFEQEQLQSLFKQVKIKQKIIDAMNRPAEKSKAWHEYRKIFITDKRIKQGAKFWQDNQDILKYATEVYGVPAEIIVAIIGVETFYGRMQGTYRVMDALSTLAFKYPKRSKFFRSELKHFLVMSQEQKFDPLSKKGSYAGAMGMGQFIPSSFRSYAIDFDGDGEKNIWSNNTDAIGSVANYFKRHGWKKGQPVADQVKLVNTTLTKKDRCRRSCKPKKTIAEFKKQGVTGHTRPAADTAAIYMRLKQKGHVEYWLGYNNFYVISRYNHSTLYSMAVYQLSQAISDEYKK